MTATVTMKMTVTAPLIAQCYMLVGLKLGLAFGIAMLESRIEA